MNALVAPELLSRIERLARTRHVGSDLLLSEAIRAYLDREEPAEEPRPRRVPGGDEGKVILAPDFNAPLPAEIEDTFYP